jgi:hypothetical protein
VEEDIKDEEKNKPQKGRQRERYKNQRPCKKIFYNVRHASTLSGLQACQLASYLFSRI